MVSYVGLLLLGTLPAVIRRSTEVVRFYKVAILILLVSLLLNLFGKGGNFDTFFMLLLYSCSVAWTFWSLLNCLDELVLIMDGAPKA